VVLVVHDIGGVFGVPWALERLDRLRGVVITNTVVFEGFPWFPVARAWGRVDWPGQWLARLRMAAIGPAGGALFRRVFGKLSPELSAEDLGRMTRELALNPVAKRSTLRLFRRMVRPEYFEGYD